MSESINWINNKLVEVYGKDIGLSLPNYRIVWSTSSYEKRYVEGPIFSESGDIYLREEKGVKEVEKYPFSPDMWVLEALQPNLANLELEVRYSYEPIWTFGANNSARQPIWKAVDYLIKIHKKLIVFSKLSPSDIDDEAREQLIREKKLCKEILQDNSPWIPNALHSGSAIVVPGYNDKPSKNGDNND